MLSSENATRADQSRRLMPEGVVDECAVRPLNGLASMSNFTAPRKIFDFLVAYPGRAEIDHKEAVVHLEVDLTEHGTIINAVPGNGVSEFQVAARQAVALWRFAPARQGKCGIPAKFGVTVKFSMN